MADQSGRALRVLREKANLTGRDLAQLAKVSESYLSRVENGSVQASKEWVGSVAAVIAETLAQPAPSSDAHVFDKTEKVSA